MRIELDNLTLESYFNYLERKKLFAFFELFISQI